MKSIKEWLNSGCDYAIGLALYNCHGQNDALKRMFAQGKSEYRSKRLKEELRGLMREEPAITIKQEPAFVAAHVGNILPENVPKPEDDPYREKWLPLYTTMNLLRHKQRYVSTDEERGIMAHQILDLEKQCNAYWEKTGYYQRTRQMAPESEEKPVVTDRNMLLQRRNNLRASRSKYKGKLKIRPDDAALQAKLLEIETEINQIEEKLL